MRKLLIVPVSALLLASGLLAGNLASTQPTYACGRVCNFVVDYTAGKALDYAWEHRVEIAMWAMSDPMPYESAQLRR